MKSFLTLYESREGEGIDEKHIIKFAFDAADDLITIGEDPIILDNDKEDRKIDPTKFINWLMPQISDDEMYYIQSAYAILDEEKYRQETLSFDKTADSFKKIIIVEKSMKPRRDEKGYVTMGVKEFLLDRDSLEA